MFACVREVRKRRLGLYVQVHVCIQGMSILSVVLQKSPFLWDKVSGSWSLLLQWGWLACLCLPSTDYNCTPSCLPFPPHVYSGNWIEVFMYCGVHFANWAILATHIYFVKTIVSTWAGWHGTWSNIEVICIKKNSLWSSLHKLNKQPVYEPAYTN